MLSNYKSNEVDIIISRMIGLEKEEHLEETVNEYKNKVMASLLLLTPLISFLGLYPS
jgi:hypothetical protein